MKCCSFFLILTCCVAESEGLVFVGVAFTGSFSRKCCLALLNKQQTPSLVLFEGDLKWEITFLNINMSIVS